MIVRLNEIFYFELVLIVRRSPKSFNLSLDCPPCLVLFKMADKISMSQRALPKVTSQRYIPNNVTLKKRQKPSAFYDRCQPSAGSR